MDKECHTLVKLIEAVLPTVDREAKMLSGFSLTYYRKDGSRVSIGLTPPEDHDSQGRFQEYSNHK